MAKNVSKVLPSQETLEHTALPFVGQALSGALATAVANLAVYPLEVVVKRLQVQRAIIGFHREKMERRRMGKRARLTLEEKRDAEERLLAFGTSSSEDGRRTAWKKRSAESDDEGLIYWSDSEVMTEKYGSIRSSGSRAVDSLRRNLEKDKRKRASIFDVDSSIGVARGRSSSISESVRKAKGVGMVFEKTEPHVEESTYTTVTPDGRVITTTTRTITERFASEDSQSQQKITKTGVGKESEPDEEEWYEEEMKSRPTLEGEDYGYYTEGDEVEDIENYAGVVDAFHKIYEREGIKGFYSGVVEDTLQNIGHGFVYFTAYTLLRRHQLSKYPRGTKSLPRVEELSLGILASAISKFFTTPVSNVVTRKQTAIFHQREESYHQKDKDRHRRQERHASNEKKIKPKADGTSNSVKFHYDARSHSYRRIPKGLMHYKPSSASSSSPDYSHSHKGKRSRSKAERITSLAILKEIYAERGIKGFWAGYAPSLFMTLNPSLTFIVYEMLRDLLPRHNKWSHAEAFLLGALAKAVASTALYPLHVVKTRSQVKYRKRMEEVEKEFQEKSMSERAGGEATGHRISVSEQKSKKALDKFKDEYRARYGGPRANIKDVIVEIFRNEGIKGFYVGLWAELLRGFVSNGITVLIKESVFHSLTTLYLNFLRIKNGQENPVTNTFNSIKREVEITLGPTTTALKNKGSQVLKDAEWVIEQGKLKFESGKEYLVSGAKELFSYGPDTATEEVKGQTYTALGPGKQFVQNRNSWAAEQVSHLRRTASHDFQSSQTRDRLSPLPSHPFTARDVPTARPPLRHAHSNIYTSKTHTRSYSAPITPELPPLRETPQQRLMALENHQNGSKDRVSSWLSQQAKVDKYENPYTPAVSATGEVISSSTSKGTGTAAGALLARNIAAAGGAAGVLGKIRGRASMPSLYPGDSTFVGNKRTAETRRTGGNFVNLHPLVGGGIRGSSFNRKASVENLRNGRSEFTGTRNTVLHGAGPSVIRRSGVVRDFRILRGEDVDMDADADMEMEDEVERVNAKRYGGGNGNGNLVGGLFDRQVGKVEYDDEDVLEAGETGIRGKGYR